MNPECPNSCKRMEYSCSLRRGDVYECPACGESKTVLVGETIE
jgi:hypothetical protein